MSAQKTFLYQAVQAVIESLALRPFSDLVQRESVDSEHPVTWTGIELESRL